ncbi:MAG TPA: hypothetical protein PLG34_07250 [Spirochaetota bacterium]|jgi:hypothetical protein|nr:MAG: hypothetical protein BWX91_01042 [Spirochaetes bacterium ADurb.Bin133]HNZ27619.1 hypothetical protein [Spirochaetota bacterium]HPY87763.1 hypothetical protein [Spirochaetota bacterium]
MDLIKKIGCFFIFIIFLLGCSTNEDDKEAPLEIKDISINEVIDRVPKAGKYQVDVELFAQLNEKNVEQDIFYEWFVESIELDIRDLTSIENIAVKDRPATTIKKIESKNYFLEVGKNPLNVLLSVYKPGYYKISLVATNLEETTEKSILLKIGEPEIPHLFLKFNIPNAKDLSADNFKGEFFIQVVNDNKIAKNAKITPIKARDVNSGWFDTSIDINPLLSFGINAGTHLVKDEESINLCSLGRNGMPTGYDGLKYDISDVLGKEVFISPILLKNIENNSIFKIYKSGNKTWSAGVIYLSLLMWGYDKKGKDEFTFIENSVTAQNKEITNFLSNKFLAKAFVGSIGHKAPLNDYYIYFSPEGLDSEELDANKKREFSSLPYGCLIGKLGENGTSFPIGSKYVYTETSELPIYEKNELNSYTARNIK